MRPASERGDAAHPCGLAHRVGKRGGGAAVHAEDREAFHAGRFDHCFEILNELVEGKRDAITIRKAAAAQVVADEGVPLREEMEPRRPDRVVPVALKMREEVGRAQQRRPAAARRVGDADAVTAGAEPDLLGQRRHESDRLTHMMVATPPPKGESRQFHTSRRRNCAGLIAVLDRIEPLSPSSCAGLTRASRLGGQSASLSEMAGT